MGALILLAVKDASAGAGRNSRLNNRPKSEGWFPEGAKPRPMLHGYSESTRPPSVGFSRGRLPYPRRRANLPNNVDGFMPFNSESDKQAGWRFATRMRISIGPINFFYLRA